jgi:hypothetical protein
MAVGNPFKERATDRTASDQAFVRLFSPKILENLPEDAFKGGVHLFVSPPGGGKTTLCRAFTPSVLQAFWGNKDIAEMKESTKVLQELGVIDPVRGPQLLGVQLTCLSGYADLPSGMPMEHDGLFRALLNCRIVLRALRSLAAAQNVSSIEQLTNITIEYPGELQELTAIPKEESPQKLAQWAEQCERKVYSHLDALNDDDTGKLPAHPRFEGVLWLQGVKFMYNGEELVPRRVLMIDDLQALRKKQRELLRREFLDLRPRQSIWLAQRTAALSDEEVLSLGAREGRDVQVHSIEALLGSGRNGFATFAQNVLDRRFETQTLFRGTKFEQYLRSDISPKELEKPFRLAVEHYKKKTARFRNETQYQEWLAAADKICEKDLPSMEDLRGLYTTRILIARNENSRQLSFVPLAAEELEERDKSSIQAAAEIFAHDEASLPTYYGMDSLCSMATNNVEELLGLAAALYDGLEANQMLRRANAMLTAKDQERLLTDAAARKRDFISRSHSEGTRSKSLIDAVGSFCREKTFAPTAPYSPGVTGVRLSQTELEKLMQGKGGPEKLVNNLRQVLSECVADNLFFVKESAATTGREGGLVFYLNRTLCAYFGLPLGLGGWQDVKVVELTEWMQLGRKLSPLDLDL